MATAALASSSATTASSRPGVVGNRSRQQGAGRRAPAAPRAAEAETAEQLLERASSSGSAKEPRIDGRAFRRSLTKTGRYVRNPANDAESLALMEEHGVGYSSTGLVAQMRKPENNNTWKQGNLTVTLAQAYGYCWGVERAVQMAYEARRQWPGAKMHVTNEIIHNPAVNKRLQEMDISIIKDVEGRGKDFSQVEPSDVVILPAFGASVQEMKLLSDRGVQIVDTTCPWVAKVWNAVDGQARKAHTSVIHGKYSHEETVATASFAETYLIVRDLEEARYVCDYITKGGDRDGFLAKFSKATSAGFDPDRDLQKIGLANQTTMLRDETLEIGKMLERAQLQRHGAERLKDTYMVMDTICDATQERQDAVHGLVDARPDMVLVVGGFNSSNTSHLQEIPEGGGVPSFWVDGARCVDVARNSITHKTAAGEMRTTSPWLPTDGRPFTLGVTSGASTPDRAVEEVLEAAFAIVDPEFKGVAPDLSLAGTTSRPEGQH